MCQFCPSIRSAVCSLLLRYVLHQENSKRAHIPIEPLRPVAAHTSDTGSVKDEKEGISSPAEAEKEEDLTDWQNKSFRYTL